jgi:transcription antitermination factor NusG
MPLDTQAALRVDTATGEPRCGRVPQSGNARVESHWGVIHTHPQAEQWACDNLKRAGYETYLPMRNATVRDRTTPTLTRVIQRPLFTSYAFVAITGPWVPIRYTPGVRALLMSGEFPSIVARAAVSALQAVEALGATTTQKESWAAPGVACSPATGAFRGCEAVITAVAGTKASVAMLIFGELRTVTTDVTSLTPRDA